MDETQNTQDITQSAQDGQNEQAGAEQGKDTPAQENAAQNAAQGAEKTFTQAELNRLIAERVKAEQKRLEKRFADEKAEAARVAAMTAEEKAAHEREQREQALSAREAELTRRERTALAKELLAEKGAPAALVGAVDIADPDGMEASAAAVAKAFADAVSAQVAKKLAGAPPKKGTPAAKDPFLDGLGV